MASMTRNKCFCSQQKRRTLILVLSRVCAIKCLLISVCHAGAVSAACSWVRLCPVRPHGVTGIGQAGHTCTVWFGGNSCEKCFLLEMALKFCPAVACAQDSLCILLGKLLLCCGWSSLLFHGDLLCDLLVCCLHRAKRWQIWSLLCHFLAPSKGFVKASDGLARVKSLGLESLLQAVWDHKYTIKYILSWA